MFFVAGCEKNASENSSNSAPDPEGTITVAMRSGNWMYTNAATKVQPDGCISSFFYITTDDNFVGGSSDYYDAGNDWKFVTVGKMSGLGNISKIPKSGWAAPVAVTPNTGYVARCVNLVGDGYGNYWSSKDTVYVRIYVMDYIVDTSGGVIGANVKYQSPFNP